MAEPTPESELARVLSRVTTRWDAQRTERTLEGLPARRDARRRRTALAAGLGGAALVALVVVVRLGAPGVDGERAERAPAAADGNRELTLVDESRVSLARGGRVEVEQSRDDLIALRMGGGQARFRVSKRPARLFRVVSGGVTVEVLGTTFELTRDGARTRVAVEEGRVAVLWADQRRELTAGEAGWFPPAPSEPAGIGSAEDEASNRAEESPAEAAVDALETTDAAPTRRKASRQGWREHAERGEFSKAYDLLEKAPERAPRSVDELMLAADAARLSGHPRAALPYLRRVIDEHPGDARAPLAAFTLGSVLMNQLGLPREAESAYRRARETTSSAALAQDALARQVEAAHRSGDGALARQLAERYVREYPQGRRLHAVRRFGGLP